MTPPRILASPKAFSPILFECLYPRGERMEWKPLDSIKASRLETGLLYHISSKNFDAGRVRKRERESFLFRSSQNEFSIGGGLILSHSARKKDVFKKTSRLCWNFKGFEFNLNIISVLCGCGVLNYFQNHLKLARGGKKSWLLSYVKLTLSRRLTNWDNIHIPFSTPLFSSFVWWFWKGVLM